MVKKLVKFILISQYRVHKMISYSTNSNKSRFLRSVVRYRLLRKYNISIGEHTKIGSNLIIPHQFNVVIGEGVKVGDNCTIFHHVTLGQNHGKYPIIGNNVTIYTGAVVVGDIKIGDNVVIGAGSIVTKNVSPNSIVAGNPAKVIKKIGIER